MIGSFRLQKERERREQLEKEVRERDGLIQTLRDNVDRMNKKLAESQVFTSCLYRLGSFRSSNEG